MLIHVRRRHIEAGLAKMSSGCPVALAVREATGQVTVVGWCGIYAGDTCSRPPKCVQRFIARFDAGKPVKPFAFVLK